MGRGEVEWVHAYLHAKINPNARDLYGRTPLHESVELRVVDVVSTLLEAGADPNAKNGDGQTPLHVATATEEFNTKVIVAKLLNVGSIATALDKDGKTPWDHAQGNKMLEGRDVYWRLNNERFEATADDDLEHEAKILAAFLANPNIVLGGEIPEEQRLDDLTLRAVRTAWHEETFDRSKMGRFSDTRRTARNEGKKPS